MKNFILSLLILLPFFSLAQSVGIGTQTPHASSVLDVASTEKGLLIPRLTTLQRTSIPGPAIGLVVFDNETSSFWVYRGDLMGGWQDLGQIWQPNGTNIYNLNSGNVGIGINNPTEKLSLNAPNATMQFLNSGSPKGYLQTSGNDMRLGTYVNNTTGNLIFNTRAVDRMWIDETGKVGIGTSAPTSVFTVNGANPWIEMQNNGVDKGFLQASGNDLRLGTNSTNTTGNLVFQTKLISRMTIDENGQVGIGTTSPTSILSISSANPTLQFKHNGIDKGFVQVSDIDDLRIGTNLSNTTGKFIVRTKGVDRFSIDANGTGIFGNASSSGGLIMNGTSGSSLILQSGNLAKGFISVDNDGLELSCGVNSMLRVRSNGDGMYFYPNGQISIGGGGQTATGYVVSIEGKAIAEEFKVLSVGSWPDYVFADNYHLKSLKDVKSFIVKNKHLPNIPAAAEMEKNGIELGDITKRLMEKVEELTLYIIDLQEQIDAMKKNESM